MKFTWLNLIMAPGFYALPAKNQEGRRAKVGRPQEASQIKRPYVNPVFPDAPIASYVCNSNTLYQKNGSGNWVILDSCHGDDVCKVSIPYYVGCAKPARQGHNQLTVNNQTLYDI